MRILLVEDNRRLHTSLRQSLEEDGYAVDSAFDGPEGELFALYMSAYAIGRVLLELVRLDSRTMQLGSIDLGLPVATVVSLLVALAMGIWMGLRRLRAKSAVNGASGSQ